FGIAVTEQTGERGGGGADARTLSGQPIGTANAGRSFGWRTATGCTCPRPRSPTPAAAAGRDLHRPGCRPDVFNPGTTDSLARETPGSRALRVPRCSGSLPDSSGRDGDRTRPDQ